MYLDFTFCPLSVKAIHSLPTSTNEPGEDSDGSENGDDDFSFLMAFPEFSSVCHEARRVLAELLSQAVKTSLDTDCMDDIHPVNLSNNGSYDFDHPLFWDAAAQACEVLMDRVDMFMQAEREKSMDGCVEDKLTTSAIKRVEKLAREKAKGGWSTLMQSLVEMEVCIKSAK